ncbi:mucin-binding protein, partial [Streptococcus suis]
RREMIENDYQELPLDLAQYLRRIPHLTPHHLERKIRRTICYLNEEREEVAESYIGEVLFEREAAVNLTTGEVSFGDWYSRYPIFDAIVPP